MAIPTFRSAPPPPAAPVKQVTIRGDATNAEKLDAVRTLLPAAGETDNRIYATKVAGETVLYVAPNARQTGGLQHDRGYTSYAARANLARQEIGDIYRACLNDTIGGDTAANGHAHHPFLLSERPDSDGTTRIDFFKGLLDSAVNTLTKTEARPDGFAPPGNANGRRSISALTTGLMRSVALKVGLISAPPDRDINRDMGEAQLHVLNTLVTNFTNRFERHAEAYAIHREDVNRPPPTLPDTNNAEIMLTATLDGLDQEYPILEIGGEQYQPIKKLGAGGFGQVVRYEGLDTGETKVVKLAKPFLEDPALSPGDNDKNRARMVEKQNRDAAVELEAGLKYANGGSVIGFTDHVKMQDGTVALIGEDVKGESVGGFTRKLQKFIDDGVIDRHQARLITLTLTKDAAEGIVALKDAGAVHGDMKPGNQIVDADGRARLIDLGMAQSGPVFQRARLQGNHTYNAPEAEFIRAAAPTSDRKAMFDNAYADLQLLAQVVDDQNVLMRDVAFTAFFDKYAAMQLDGGTYALDNQADVFGAGVTLMKMFSGYRPNEWREHDYLVQTYGAEAARNPSETQLDDMRAALRTGKVEASKSPEMGGVYGDAAGSGYAPRGVLNRSDMVVDALLNDMLAPSRDRRISPEGIATHPAMRYGAHDGTEAVGSPEVRTLIKAIASDKHPDEVMLEAINLSNAHPQTEAFEDPLPRPAPTAAPAEIDLPPPPPGPPPATAA
ncbi:MAG: hypothetical protein AAF318_01185 [Pseudomonadota bacterium]